MHAVSIRKKGNGYEVRVYAGIDEVTRKRKYISRMRKTLKQAQILEGELLKQVENDTYVVPSKQSVKDFLDEWLEKVVKPKKRIRTYETYRAWVRLHIVPEIGEVKLRKLTPRHVEHMLANRSEYVSVRSCLHIYRVLHRALEVAFKWGYIARNPCALVDAPIPDEPEHVILSREQIKKFLASAKKHSRFYPVYVLAVKTGMREGEIFGLRWKDIDYQEAALWVRQKLTKPGKNPVFGAVKNHLIRAVPLNEELIQLLREVKVDQEVNRTNYGSKYEDYDLVFCQPFGRPVAVNSFLRWDFKKVWEESGLPRFTFHTFRHTYISRGLQAGGNVKALADIVGHHDAGFTLRTYAHASDDDKRETIRLIDAYYDEG